MQRAHLATMVQRLEDDQAVPCAPETQLRKQAPDCSTIALALRGMRDRQDLDASDACQANTSLLVGLSRFVLCNTRDNVADKHTNTQERGRAHLARTNLPQLLHPKLRQSASVSLVISALTADSAMPVQTASTE